MYEHVDALRQFRRAIRRLDERDHEGAFRDALGAFRLKPGENAVRGLFVTVARQTIDSLCAAHDYEKAQEIAEQAWQAAPQEDTVAGGRARVMLSRLDLAQLLSDDQSTLTTLETLVASRLKGEADADSIAHQGRAYAATLDRELGIERKLNEARQLMGEHLFGLALELMAGIAAEGREAIICDLLKVQCLRELGDLDGALRVAQALVQNYPEYGPCHHAYGRVLSFRGMFEEARRELTEAKEMDAENYGALKDLAQNAYWAGWYDEAAADFAIALTHDAGGIVETSLLAICLLHLHREPEVPALMRPFLSTVAGDHWYSILIEWFCGNVSDEQLLHQAHTNLQRSESSFYVGEKWRAQGRVTEGNKLLKNCAELGLWVHIEPQTVEAMRRGGRLDGVFEGH
jgi:tetratricopeptide (TPR) repeat protein